MEERVCTACVFCSRSGTGYSEYTILGEDYECLLKIMPEVSDDDSDEKCAAAFATAQTCPAYREGTGPRLGLYCDDEKTEMLDWARLNFGTESK